MFKPTDHVVRSIFNSYGLYGPLTRGEIDFGYDAAGSDHVEIASREVLVSYKDQPLVLENDGVAVDAAKITGFADLNEVYELVELMAANARFELRLYVFIQLQRGYNGRTQSTRLGTQVVVDPTLTEPFTVTSEQTRRGNMRITEVRTGPNFKWHEFARAFSALTAI